VQDGKLQHGILPLKIVVITEVHFTLSTGIALLGIPSHEKRVSSEYNTASMSGMQYIHE